METLSWPTDIMKAINGTEVRASLTDTPRRSLALSFTLLDDDSLRDLRAELYRYPSDLRLIPLRHDALTVKTIAGTSLTVTASSLALWDWNTPGQRLYVYNDKGEGYLATLQSGVADVITVDVSPSGGTFVNGSTYVAPLVQAYLADGEAIGRYTENAGHWQAQAISTLFQDAMGTGAGVMVAYDGHYLIADDITPFSEQLIQEKTDGGLEVVDYGAALREYTIRDNSDISRTHEFQADGRPLIQWWRLFLFTLRGPFNTFLLSTYRNDFELFTDLDGTDTIYITAAVDDTPDYVTDWFPSTGHAYLRFDYDDGSAVYRKVEAATDVGDGSQELILDDVLDAGTVVRISLAEVCRLASDDVALRFYAQDRMEFTLAAKVVEQ